MDIVRTLVLEAGRAWQQQTMVSAEIGQLIPELSPEATQRTSLSDPERARFRLFDAVATLLKQLARSRPLRLTSRTVARGPVFGAAQWPSAPAGSFDCTGFATFG